MPVEVLEGRPRRRVLNAEGQRIAARIGGRGREAVGRPHRDPAGRVAGDGGRVARAGRRDRNGEGGQRDVLHTIRHADHDVAEAAGLRRRARELTGGRVEIRPARLVLNRKRQRSAGRGIGRRLERVGRTDHGGARGGTGDRQRRQHGDLECGQRYARGAVAHADDDVRVGPDEVGRRSSRQRSAAGVKACPGRQVGDRKSQRVAGGVQGRGGEGIGLTRDHRRRGRAGDGRRSAGRGVAAGGSWIAGAGASEIIAAGYADRATGGNAERHEDCKQPEAPAANVVCERNNHTLQSRIAVRRSQRQARPPTEIVNGARSGRGAGNPAISGNHCCWPETGGFASPPCGGFALASGASRTSRVQTRNMSLGTDMARVLVFIRQRAPQQHRLGVASAYVGCERACLGAAVRGGRGA